MIRSSWFYFLGVFFLESTVTHTQEEKIFQFHTKRQSSDKDS